MYINKQYAVLPIHNRKNMTVYAIVHEMCDPHNELYLFITSDWEYGLVVVFLVHNTA